jgi:serine/threonine protein phosphatase PrpC
VRLARGDWLVVCSAGLHARLSDAALKKAVDESLQAADLADHLADLAEKGGGDNCTVIAAFYY